MPPQGEVKHLLKGGLELTAEEPHYCHRISRHQEPDGELVDTTWR